MAKTRTADLQKKVPIDFNISYREPSVYVVPIDSRCTSAERLAFQDIAKVSLFFKKTIKKRLKSDFLITFFIILLLKSEKMTLKVDV